MSCFLAYVLHLVVTQKFTLFEVSIGIEYWFVLRVNHCAAVGDDLCRSLFKFIAMLDTGS